jgi:hypothetical protein
MLILLWRAKTVICRGIMQIHSLQVLNDRCVMLMAHLKIRQLSNQTGGIMTRQRGTTHANA